jgi:hypothetical protein
MVVYKVVTSRRETIMLNPFHALKKIQTLERNIYLRLAYD